MRASLLVSVVVLGALSCGGGAGTSHVEISGKSPTEASALAAGAVCRREAECGDVSIQCVSGGAAGGAGSDAGGPTTSCTANVSPIVYDDCVREAGADIAELLACPTLTPAQVDTLEICFDALARAKCVTQADADQRARAIAAGETVAPETRPAECELLSHPPAGCGGAAPKR